MSDRKWAHDPVESKSDLVVDQAAAAVTRTVVVPGLVGYPGGCACGHLSVGSLPRATGHFCAAARDGAECACPPSRATDPESTCPRGLCCASVWRCWGCESLSARLVELGWSTAVLVIVAVPLTIGFGWLLAGRSSSMGALVSCRAGRLEYAGPRLRWPLPWRGRARIGTGHRAGDCLHHHVQHHRDAHVPCAAFASAPDSLQAGRFLGGSIHDVAQVVAAGYATSPKAGDTATIVKLMRVAMLLPVVLCITLKIGEAFYDIRRRRQNRRQQGVPAARISRRLRRAYCPERLQPVSPSRRWLRRTSRSGCWWSPSPLWA